MNERIKLLRKSVGLSQKEFGEKIGIGDTAVSKLEKGERNPSEQTIKSICREFNVSIAWIKEGLGDMFTNLPETMLDEIADLYNLNNKMKNLIKTLLELDDKEQECLISILERTFIQKDE